jgi:hypothetical protein
MKGKELTTLQRKVLKKVLVYGPMPTALLDRQIRACAGYLATPRHGLLKFTGKVTDRRGRWVRITAKGRQALRED